MIVLRAKQVEFDVTYINLREKPDWFLAISPHGKVPVLEVDDEPLFESNAIAEYLDETIEPRMHPADPIQRARNRAWTDFVPEFSRSLGTVSYAKSREAMNEAMAQVPKPLSRLEEALGHEQGDDGGPLFNGSALSLVDAAYAPFLQRFAIVEEVLKTGLLNDYPRLAAWTEALVTHDCVINSVPEGFDEKFRDNLARREAYAYQLMAAS